MAIRFIDEEPKRKIRFIDEEQRPTAQSQQKVGLTGSGKFLPTFISGQTPARGERTLFGNIFERPGAVSRASIREQPLLRMAGPLAGTVALTGVAGKKAKEKAFQAARFPEEVETFQEERLRKSVTPGAIKAGERTGIFSPQTPIGKGLVIQEAAMRGVLPSAIGLAEDILTNPADVLTAVAGDLFGGTKVGKSFGKFMGKARTFKASADKQLIKAVDKPFKKAIGIKVKGKPTASRTTKQIEKTRDAVKTILENKQTLQFTDELGRPIQKLPESVTEFSQSIEQTKNVVLKQLDNLTTTTGESGARVSPKKAIKIIDDFINNEAIQRTNPSAIKQAQALKQSIGTERMKPSTANEMVRIWNDEGGAFFRGQTTSDPKIIALKGKLATGLKESLIESVEGATGSQFRLLRNKLGSLLSIEDDVGRKAISIMNKQSKKGAIPQITDVFSNAQIARGVLTANPGDIVAGATQKATLAMIKRANNPDRIIRKMFTNADKIGIEFIQSFTPEILTDLPVSTLSKLSGPKSKLALPSPKDVSFNPSGSRVPGGKPFVTPFEGGGTTIAGSSPIPQVKITPEAQNLLTFDPRMGQGKRFGKWFTVRNP